MKCRCKKCKKCKSRAYYQKNKERIRGDKKKQARDSKRRRRNYLKRQYSLKVKNVDEMLLSQKYKCAICTLPLDTTTAKIDHSHKSGKIRGLLCNKCNLLLGHANDLIRILKKAILYLRKNK